MHGRLLAAGEAPPTPATAPRSEPPTRTTPRSSRRRATADLVEREDELAAVDGALDRVLARSGGVVLFEGPAGVGKTRLLQELRRGAVQRDAAGARGRAKRVEREFGFGVVRQLLEPVGEEQMQGAAAGARAVRPSRASATGRSRSSMGCFGWSATRPRPAAGAVRRRPAVERPGLAAVHGVPGPADRRAARGCRRDRPHGRAGRRRGLLAELAQEPATVALSPRSVDDARHRAPDRGGPGESRPGVLKAAEQVTAGNPLLLGQLLMSSPRGRCRRRPATSPLSARSGHGPRPGPFRCGCGGCPRPRARSHGAVAVLGEQRGPGADRDGRHRRADGGPGGPGAGQSGDPSRRRVARVRAPADPRCRVCGAPATGASAGARARRAVARRFGASPSALPPSCCSRPPPDPWVVTALREAAHLGPEARRPRRAMRLLERAQAEPPPPEQRAALAFELGGSAAYLRGPAGVEPLRRPTPA